jgi:hypothetical protein
MIIEITQVWKKYPHMQNLFFIFSKAKDVF